MRNLDSAALVQPDGTILFVQPKTAADVATLPQATILCHRYLTLQNRDVAVTNDPYSGGTLASDFTLVMGLGFHPKERNIDLLIAARISLNPRLPAAEKLDGEGVRVPPMPLAQAGVLNRELLTAIAAHPLAPQDLFARVEAAIEQLSQTADLLTRISREPGSILRALNFQNYLKDSGRAFETLMAKLPLGSVNVSTTLSSGEMLKLHLKISEERLLFDFAGSDNSTAFALTELATFGACWAAIISTLGESVPINSATFEHLQVSAPSRTFLSASAPRATLRGMTEGIASVGRVVQDALCTLQSKLQSKQQSGFRTGSSPSGVGIFQLVFSDTLMFSLQVPGGSGAAVNASGSDVAGTWSRQERFLPDPEAIERAFPIHWLEIAKRPDSGGAGRNSGGHGAILALELRQDCELRWLDGSLGRKSSGVDGGRPGIPGAIEIIRAGKTDRDEHREPEGKTALRAGDRVYILSGGGGGFGAPVNDKDDGDHAPP